MSYRFAGTTEYRTTVRCHFHDGSQCLSSSRTTQGCSMTSVLGGTKRSRCGFGLGLHRVGVLQPRLHESCGREAHTSRHQFVHHGYCTGIRTQYGTLQDVWADEDRMVVLGGYSIAEDRHARQRAHVDCFSFLFFFPAVENKSRGARLRLK